MTVNKGFLSIVENTPNFSNQALENSVGTLKLGWVLKSSQLDSLIVTNSILTASQKTDLKADINNLSHINLGRVLGDLIRHSATIIDATIIPVGTNETQTETFLSILQNVQTVQGLIPELYGVPAEDKARAVNDHLGTINNIFVDTEDSSAPVFTTLLESIKFIVTANLATETALETAYTNLINFINDMVADSTDFQTTLDSLAAAVATAHTNLNTALAAEPLLTHKNRLITMMNEINAQITRENANLVGLETFIETLSSNQSFASLAEDTTLRRLMSKVAQDKNWQTYFEDYETNQNNLNPIYTTNTDSDKDAIIDQVLADSGLPDVTDATDLVAVAAKARRDDRIDTAGYDRLTVEKQISDASKQLLITTANRTIFSLSNTLLNNMNKRDRDKIAKQLDLNQSANTLS
jgi:hypothetical protein|tara:strand:- start:150 stop:1379 length:1230 start_codon:yes stop_codon:yes gene_type:complete